VQLPAKGFTGCIVAADSYPNGRGGGPDNQPGGAIMLVLTRKPGEGIIIGDDVKITIVEMKGGGVRIGIDAPRDMKVHRQEVFDRIKEENREAAQWDIADLNELSNLIKPGGEQ
jgi:carbon storage regulator